MTARSAARTAACPANREASQACPMACNRRAAESTSAASISPARTRIQQRAAPASTWACG